MTDKKLDKISGVIHQYKNNGYNIVLDVNSGSVHVVDDLMYDILPLYKKKTSEELQAHFSRSICRRMWLKAHEEIRELEENEQLFTEDIYENYIFDFKKRPTVVKAFACILRMTVTLPASIALRRKANTTDGVRL